MCLGGGGSGDTENVRALRVGDGVGCMNEQDSKGERIRKTDRQEAGGF